MPSPPSIGNRLAPKRYLMFIMLLVAGVAAGIALRGWQQGVMIGFDVASTAFLASCLALFDDTPAKMRADAKANDANRVLLLVLSLIISIVILVAVGLQLADRDRLGAFEITLVIATLVLVWTFANAVYTLHYAHLYYGGDDAESKDGGLYFPGGGKPDYGDFCYFAFTIGVALQTADVNITSRRFRRVVTAHCIAAFFFNLGVLALSVSVLSGA